MGDYFNPIRCMSGGQCHLHSGGKEFTCTCADGYLGDNCQRVQLCFVRNLSNKYDNFTIIDAVDNASIPDDKRGAIFTGKALAFVKDHSFATTNGGRADVDRYVIILTDGMPSAPLDTANQTKLLRLSYPNIRIKSIGSGEFVFHKELWTLALTL
ncbi:hypothetical protein DPMN_106095 [Dreissena polymorpha]|uniref:EGF-like domain-containing protein n=1 Tax=Dreissena polymorpha TaxID=45954 RepID=A0A9D4QJD4_DREPO|nr:hypothetical protein DPMN_106095 [Dreissena polymorpha]